MTKRTKKTPVERLMEAMDGCAVARGEAQWMNGYRTALRKSNPAEAERLWAKEQTRWKIVDEAERAYRRLAQRVIREAQRTA